MKLVLSFLMLTAFIVVTEEHQDGTETRKLRYSYVAVPVEENPMFQIKPSPFRGDLNSEMEFPWSKPRPFPNAMHNNSVSLSGRTN